MLQVASTLCRRVHEHFELIALCLLAVTLPSAIVPSGLALFCAAAAWLSFCLALLSESRTLELLFQVGAGAALALLAGLAPLTWCATALVLSVVAAIERRERALLRARIALAVGVLFPAALYAALYASGSDARSALRLAFRCDVSALELSARTAALILIVALTLAGLSRAKPGRRDLGSAFWRCFAALPLILLGWRLVWIVSVASLRTDLLIWSEPPMLANLLKLASGETFYGPLEWANSYSYSPGLELFQYLLLRPFNWALSLRAHRALGVLWQLSSAAVLSKALWPWLGSALRARLGWMALPALVGALGCVSFSNFLAPHVHPDHLLLLCFCFAIALCLRRDPFTRRDTACLFCLPIAATAFKLTGAGIGFGLLLAALPGRHLRALGVLMFSGIAAVLTIPLFDATLGDFSTYAIRLQASRRTEWHRIWQLPLGVPGFVFGISCILVLLAWFERPQRANVQAALRVLLLTAGFGSLSLFAFLKQAARENSLLPWTIGGAVALLALLGQTAASARSTIRAPLPSGALAVVLCWLSLWLAWPKVPVWAGPRRALVVLHEREVSWLSDSLARGLKPLACGTAAWIDVGRRDAPHDAIGPASELDLGHWQAVESFERRLTDGSYDQLFLPASVLVDNALFLRLRPALERVYRVTPQNGEPQPWPTSHIGVVSLERRSPSP